MAFICFNYNIEIPYVAAAMGIFIIIWIMQEVVEYKVVDCNHIVLVVCFSEWTYVFNN